MPRHYFLYFSWIVALAATLGSLLLSEFFHFPPCVLCWYQRILMYPLVIILAVGILKKEANIHYYVLPFTGLGLLIAFYHWLLQLGLLPQALELCASGVSCTTEYFRWLGIVTIPTLSFIAFALITVSLLIYVRGQDHAHDNRS